MPFLGFVCRNTLVGGSECDMSEDQVLTIKDIAAILKLAEKTIYSMAQDGEIPAFKIRGPVAVAKGRLR